MIVSITLLLTGWRDCPLLYEVGKSRVKTEESLVVSIFRVTGRHTSNTNNLFETSDLRVEQTCPTLNVL